MGISTETVPSPWHGQVLIIPSRSSRHSLHPVLPRSFIAQGADHSPKTPSRQEKSPRSQYSLPQNTADPNCSPRCLCTSTHPSFGRIDSSEHTHVTDLGTTFILSTIQRWNGGRVFNYSSGTDWSPFVEIDWHQSLDLKCEQNSCVGHPSGLGGEYSVCGVHSINR